MQSGAAEPVPVKFPDTAQADAAWAVDCTWMRSLPDLEACVKPVRDRADPGNPALIFVPVAWDEVETQPGQRNWTAPDRAVAYLQDQGLTPVLALGGAPRWLWRHSPGWDRDNPRAVSSHPHEFAAFAARTAQRYRERVRYLQLGTAANVALGDFPFAASPVRYGQMAALAARAIRRSAPDTAILSAPLVPVTTATLAAMPPDQWLARFQVTPGAAQLDILQWRPRLSAFPGHGAGQAAAATLLMHDPFHLPHPKDIASLHWWFADPLHPASAFRDPQGRDSRLEVIRPTPPGNWLTAVPDAMLLPGPEGPVRGVAWRRWLGWALCLLTAVAVWQQATAAFRKLAQAGSGWVKTHRPWLRDGLVIAVTLSTLGAIVASPGWSVTCLCFVMLLGLTWLKPHLLWLLLLAALPFDYIHADIATPLQQQALSLSPAQLLALAQFPVWVASAERRIRLPTGRTVPWPVIGVGVIWLLLAVLCHPQRPEATRWSQVWELELYPLFVAGLSWWWLSRTRAFRPPLAALSVGIGLFAAIALAIWLVSPWTTGAPELRLSGLTFSPNHAAMILLRGFWLALGLAALQPQAGHRRTLYRVMAVLAGWALLLTFSRGALILGLPAGLGVWLWRRRRTSRKSAHRFPLPALGLVTGVTGALGGLAVLRLNLGERLLDATPIAARWAIWRHTWDLWLRHPWFGQGSDGFYWNAAAHFPYSPLLNPEILHPHNVGLEILVRSGLAGLLGMALLCVLLFRALRVAGRDVPGGGPGIAAGTALAGGLAQGLVDAFWSLPDIAAINLVLVVIILLGAQKKGPGTCAPDPISSQRTET